MNNLETRCACNSGETKTFSGETPICPKCQKPMMKDSATGEWVCVNCN